MAAAAVPAAEDEPLFTDEGQVAPGVATVAPPIEEGGSAAPEPPPGGIAQPADIPGGQLNTDQLMAAAAGAPNPQGDAVDQLLAANPQAAGSQAPGVPGASAPPPAPSGAGAPGAVTPVAMSAPGAIQNAELANQAEQDQLTAQGVEAKQREGQATARAAEAEQKGAEREAVIQAQAQKDQQKVLDTAAANTQQWMANAQEQAQRYQQMQLHDFWADKGTGSKVLAGIAMLFGAAGKTSAADNPALTIINGAIDRDFRMQQAAIEKAKGNVDIAREQYSMGLTAKQQALADNNLKKASALDAAAAQTIALKLKQGVPLAQAQNDQAVVALKQKANDTRLETLKLVHSQNVQDAQLKIEQERADAMMLRANKYKTRTGGAGGGGGASGVQKLTEWLEANPNAPESQKQAMAIKNGVPLDAKAGRSSLKTVQAEIAGRAKNEQAAGKAGLGQERQLSKESQAWAKANQIPAILKKQQELSSVLDEIKNAPHNPLQQALAIEKAVSSARGGAASRQALDLAMHHLGGRWDSIEAFIQAGKNGEIGEKQMENFVGFMNNQLGTAQKEGKDKYDAFNKYIESQPAERKAELEAQRGEIFSGMSGFGGKAKPTVSNTQKVLAAKRVVDDPTAPQKAKDNASNYLRSIGAL